MQLYPREARKLFSSLRLSCCLVCGASFKGGVLNYLIRHHTATEAMFSVSFLTQVLYGTAQMQHNASLEAENAELRSELAAIAAAREAAESALLRASAERAVAAEAAAGQQVLAAAEAERCKTTGLRLLELADHAALVAAAYEVPALNLCLSSLVTSSHYMSLYQIPVHVFVPISQFMCLSGLSGRTGK